MHRTSSEFRRRVRWIAAALTALAGVVLYARVYEPVLPEAEPVFVTQAYVYATDTLHRGETLGVLLERNDVASFDLLQLGRTVGLDPKRLRAGLEFVFRRTPAETQPSMMTVRTSPDERLRFTHADHGWSVMREPIVWDRETVRVVGDINRSLYTALDRAIPDDMLDGGERVRLAWDLADVYAWSVDFSRDIQAGDQFTVLLEREVSEEGEIRYGRVLAAALEVSGKVLPAFRFDEAKPGEFFDDQGKSLRRAFLRAPLEFRRISSNFSQSRFHPVLRIRRRHTGTDYSASAGTPVLAAGDGVVIRAGRMGTYGNLVEIRHINGIRTRYAHLRGFARGIRSGARVSQGSVIGYVGSTGLATSAHLHYEFLVNGVARDSRRVNLGDGKPVAADLHDLFETERDRLTRLLLATAPSPVAVIRRGD